MDASKLAAGFFVFGAAGWALENLLFGPHYSQAAGGRLQGIPFVPMYGAGAAIVMLVAPKLKKLPAPTRAGIYAGVLTGFEYATCKVDRALGGRKWDYDGECIDVPHSVAWGGLGLVVEQATKGVR